MLEGPWGAGDQLESLHRCKAGCERAHVHRKKSSQHTVEVSIATGHRRRTTYMAVTAIDLNNGAVVGSSQGTENRSELVSSPCLCILECWLVLSAANDASLYMLAACLMELIEK